MLTIPVVSPQLWYGDDLCKDGTQPLWVNKVEVTQVGFREVEKDPIVVEEEGALVHVIFIVVRLAPENGTPKGWYG